MLVFVRLFALFTCLLLLSGCSKQSADPNSTEGTEFAGDDLDFSNETGNSGSTSSSISVSPGMELQNLPTKLEDDSGKSLVEEKKFQELYAVSKVPKRRWVARVYSDGTRTAHGAYKEFYENGKLYCQGSFQQGKRHGEWVFMHESGQEAKRGSYIDDKTDGKWIIKNQQGGVIRQESYKLGKKHGKWLIYDRKTSVLRKEHNWADGIRDGMTKEWFDTGKIALEVSYRAGKLHGERKRWHRNGTRASVEIFQDDLKHGKAISWNQNGNVMVEQVFHNNRLISTARPDADNAPSS